MEGEELRNIQIINTPGPCQKDAESEAATLQCLMKNVDADKMTHECEQRLIEVGGQSKLKSKGKNYLKQVLEQGHH